MPGLLDQLQGMDDEKMSRISHSEVEAHLLCRRKWFYGYGLSLQKVTTSTALATGTAGHAVLQAFYDYLSDFSTAKDQRAHFNDGVLVARARYDELVVEGYEDTDPRRNTLEDMLFKWYFPNEPLVKEGWQILSSEEEFVLEYDDTGDEPLQYPFVVDVIAIDPAGKTVVVDHKFSYDFLSYEETELQPQIAKYIGALRALNHKVDYGAYNQIRTRRIVGTKSKAAPDGAGPTLAQALDFMPIKPSSTRVQTVFLEQIGVSAEIQARKALPLDVLDRSSYRVANKMVCQSCSFKELCTAELTGGNAELVRRTEYKVRERKVFAEAASEEA